MSSAWSADDTPELKALELVDTISCWVFDPRRRRHLFANSKALRDVFRKSSLQELLDDQMEVCEATDKFIQTTVAQWTAQLAAGRQASVVVQPWTFFPNGVPLRTFMRTSPFVKGGQIFLFCQEIPQQAMEDSADLLRTAEALRYIDNVIALIDPRPTATKPVLWSNNAALFLSTLPSAPCQPNEPLEHWLLGHLVDRELAYRLVLSLQEMRSAHADFAKITHASRTHISLSLWRVKDPLNGDDLILIQEQDQSAHMRQQQHIIEMKRLAQLKDTFLSVVSHELRTPLHGIIGMAEIVKADVDERRFDSCKTNLDNIDACARRLSNLVNNMLDLTCLQQHRLKLNLAPVALPPLAQRCLALAAAANPDSGVTGEVQCDGDMPPVMADAERVEQLLGNLLTNAFRYTPPGGTITIGMTVIAEGTHARISVRDTGAGICPELFPSIFEPFVSLDHPAEPSDKRLPASTTVTRSTGLGLAIVAQICKQLGGSVWAESTVGKGSRFNVLLPLVCALPPRERLPSDSDTYAHNSLVEIVRAVQSGVVAAPPGTAATFSLTSGSAAAMAASVARVVASAPPSSSSSSSAVSFSCPSRAASPDAQPQTSDSASRGAGSFSGSGAVELGAPIRRRRDSLSQLADVISSPRQSFSEFSVTSSPNMLHAAADAFNASFQYATNSLGSLTTSPAMMSFATPSAANDHSSNLNTSAALFMQAAAVAAAAAAASSASGFAIAAAAAVAAATTAAAPTAPAVLAAPATSLPAAAAPAPSSWSSARSAGFCASGNGTTANPLATSDVAVGELFPSTTTSPNMAHSRSDSGVQLLFSASNTSDSLYSSSGGSPAGALGLFQPSDDSLALARNPASRAQKRSLTEALHTDAAPQLDDDDCAFVSTQHSLSSGCSSSVPAAHTITRLSPAELADMMQQPLDVLSVDDDRINQAIVRRLLSATKWRVETAMDGVCAMEAIERQKPDLMLLDLMMPRMSGEEVLRELKKREWLDFPIMVVSAASGELSLEGATAFMSKPFRSDVAIPACAAIVAQAQGRRSSNIF